MLRNYSELIFPRAGTCPSSWTNAEGVGTSVPPFGNLFSFRRFKRTFPDPSAKILAEQLGQRFRSLFPGKTPAGADVQAPYR